MKDWWLGGCLRIASFSSFLEPQAGVVSEPLSHTKMKMGV